MIEAPSRIMISLGHYIALQAFGITAITFLFILISMLCRDQGWYACRRRPFGYRKYFNI